MLKTIIITVGQLDTNCYIAFNDETKVGVIIDPADCPVDLMATAEKYGIKLEAIFLTHTHFDHVGAIVGMQEKMNLPVYVCEQERWIKQEWKDVRFVEDGQVVSVGGLDYKFIITPGHSTGSLCIISGAVIFTGDTLFWESCGRTDLPGGNYNAMIRSLKRLYDINGDYRIFPGHGPDTMLHNERLHNPYMDQASKCK